MPYKPYTVTQGDCISSIAYQHGFFPDTLWNDPKNRELKRKREDPNILFPGDVVHIRDKEEREESCAPEQRHRFKRKGVPELLRVQLVDENGAPAANAAYTIEVDGELRLDRKTDASGWVKETIPPDAREATLTLTETKIVYRWALGYLDPINTIEGAQARLNNLGYDCGPVDGSFGEKTRAALREFQSDHDLALIEDNAKAIGKETLEALEKAHLS